MLRYLFCLSSHSSVPITLFMLCASVGLPSGRELQAADGGLCEPVGRASQWTGRGGEAQRQDGLRRAARSHEPQLADLAGQHHREGEKQLTLF